MATKFFKFFKKKTTTATNMAELVAEAAAEAASKAAEVEKKNFWAHNARKIKEDFISSFAEEFIKKELSPIARRGEKHISLKKADWAEREEWGQVYIGPTHGWESAAAYKAAADPANYRPAKNIWQITYRFARRRFRGPNPDSLQGEEYPYTAQYIPLMGEWEDFLSPFLGSEEFNRLLAEELKRRKFTTEMERGYLSRISW